MKHHRRLWNLTLALCAAFTAGHVTNAYAKDGVQITQLTDRIRVEINDQLFTEYCFDGKLYPTITKGKDAAGNSITKTNPTKHVYFYPVLGPSGLPMTRKWPMVPDSKDEEKDHPHHRSLWFSHGAVNGIDFWSETPEAGQIVHDRFLDLKSGKDQGVIRSTCKWIAPSGKVVCTDQRVFRVYARPNKERLFDFEVTILAPADEDVVLGDTKEGSMSCRVAESMRLTHANNKPGLGHIVQSTGVKDQKTWGKPADWCDYYGPVEGKTVGISIFDHPGNPVHPTTWHVRDYGLFGANPFGLHDFDKKPAGAGDLKIPTGKSLTFRYRFYIHEGDTEQAKVGEQYDAYVKEIK